MLSSWCQLFMLIIPSVWIHVVILVPAVHVNHTLSLNTSPHLGNICPCQSYPLWIHVLLLVPAVQVIHTLCVNTYLHLGSSSLGQSYPMWTHFLILVPVVQVNHTLCEHIPYPAASCSGQSYHICEHILLSWCQLFRSIISSVLTHFLILMPAVQVNHTICDNTYPHPGASFSCQLCHLC